MYLGDYIVIEQETGPYEYACISVSTGTSFQARIDDDKRELFRDRSWIELHATACPFLRPKDDRIICTIHGTSPPQCKAYRCVVLRIHSAEGIEIGTVTGTLALHTSDVKLRQEWERDIGTISGSDIEEEKRIARFLESKGYHVT